MTTRITPKIALISIVFLFILTGCMYPDEQRQEFDIPIDTQVEMIQTSVDTFYERTGNLPIHNFDADTPVYERYMIDFHRLVHNEVLDNPPPAAYESGGPYRFVLVNVEHEPEVKLMDIRLSQEVRSVQQRLNQYLHEGNYLPIDEILGAGYFSIDYERLGLAEAPQVTSPYSGNELALIANNEGRVAIDYRLDIMLALEEVAEDKRAKWEAEQTDIRALLVEDSLLTPAHSFAYKLEDGVPVFAER